MHLTEETFCYSPGIVEKPGVSGEASNDHLRPEQLGGELQLVVVNQPSLLCNQSQVSSILISQSELT